MDNQALLRVYNQLMKKNKKNIRFIWLIGISILWFLFGWFGRDLLNLRKPGLLESTLSILKTQALFDAGSGDHLAHDAIRGMLISLGDPHAALLAPPVSERFEADFAGESGMVGMSHEKRGDQIIITHIFPSQPAEEAGLKVNDILLEVDGFSVTPLTSATEISYMIRGPVGQPVTLVVQRDGQILTFSPTREARKIITAEMLNGEIGYIAQYTFTTNADEQFSAALENLISQGARKIIWDLRSNGGGSVQTAQAILSHFFAKENVLYHVAFPDGSTQAYYPIETYEILEIPLVVLVGEHTYSAAEMSAAAVQDWSRGVILGEQTYGKGTIQATNHLTEDLLLQISIAKWLSPQEIWYEGVGLTPDILVGDNPSTPEDEVIEKAIEVLLSKE